MWDDEQLTRHTQALIQHAGNQKYISAATYWEIAIKMSIGKLDLGEPYRPFMRREMARNNFEVLASERGPCGGGDGFAVSSS